MALKSKLSAKYPMADPKEWLVFLPGVDPNIDPIFLGRLAAWARDHKVKLQVNSGYRAIEKQISLFLAQGGKFDPKLGYYWPATVPAHRRTVAKPGKSYHNFRLAIDTSSMWAKAINKTEATLKQTELLKYGIFKPMTRGNGQVVLEDWHLQPIETLNVPVDKRAEWMPTEVNDTPVQSEKIPTCILKYGMRSEDVKLLQKKLNEHGSSLAIDGDFGKKTLTAVNEFKTKMNLTNTGEYAGVVGPTTWEWLYKKK